MVNPDHEDSTLWWNLRRLYFYIDNNEVLNPGVETLKDAIVRVAGDDRARPVVLRADARTQHQAVITAMDALGQLGFDRLSLATMPSKAPEQR